MSNAASQHTICFTTQWSSTKTQPTLSSSSNSSLKEGELLGFSLTAAASPDCSTYLSFPGYTLSCRDGNSRFLVPQMHWRNFTALYPLTFFTTVSCNGPQNPLKCWSKTHSRFEKHRSIDYEHVDRVAAIAHTSAAQYTSANRSRCLHLYFFCL